MSKLFEYKGYQGSVESDLATEHLYGKVLFINDLVTYTADTIKDLRKEFETSVDEYLAVCEELGDEPDKPFNGTFNVRLGPELHRKAAITAAQQGTTLNDYVKVATEMRIDGGKGGERVVRHEHMHTFTVHAPDKEIAGNYSSAAGDGWKPQKTLRLVK